MRGVTTGPAWDLYHCPDKMLIPKPTHACECQCNRIHVPSAGGQSSENDASRHADATSRSPTSLPQPPCKTFSVSTHGNSVLAVIPSFPRVRIVFLLLFFTGVQSGHSS